MAGRIRSIKPEWNESESLGSCSDAARVLSVSLILLADDHGNGRAHPGYLAGQAWCYSGASIPKAEKAMAELERVGYVEVYEVAGSLYFHLTGWKTHQRVDKPGKERVPVPDAGVIRGSPGKVRETLARTREGVATSQENPGPDHDHEYDHEYDHDHEREGDAGEPPDKPAASPPARRERVAADPDAFFLADRLREAVLAMKSNHRVGEERSWKQSRPSWARILAQTLRRRPRAAIEAAIAFVQEQHGQPYAFTVESARALDDKLDRIEVAMTKRAHPPNGHVGHYKHTGDEVYASGDVDL